VLAIQEQEVEYVEQSPRTPTEQQDQRFMLRQQEIVKAHVGIPR
jgi:hypothetical protein